MQASRTCGVVGLDARRLDIVSGPQARVACELTLLLRPIFQRADAGFDGTIVRGRMGW